MLTGAGFHEQGDERERTSRRVDEGGNETSGGTAEAEGKDDSRYGRVSN